MPVTPPPQHAFTAFGVSPEATEHLGGVSWRSGEVVFTAVSDPVEAAWVAQTMSSLDAVGVRLARPLRSRDGRWVVGGWTAFRQPAGTPEPRYDDVVDVSLRLHKATATLACPRFLAERDDAVATADAVAWGEQEVPLDPQLGGKLFAELAGARQAVGLRPQVVHGDMFGNVLFAGSAPPAVVTFAPFWRPAEWAAGVIVIDAVAWGGADDGLVERWAHLAEWPQAVLHALLFRVAVHAMHPASTAESLAGLQRTANLVRRLL